MLYLVKHYCQCQCRKRSWTVHLRSALLLSNAMEKSYQKARQTSPERQKARESPIFFMKSFTKKSAKIKFWV